METLLAALPLLACPIGMGIAMWLMMRNKGDQAASSPPPATDARAPGPVNSDAQLAGLHAQLREVQARQAAVADQIARLASDERPAPPAGAAPRKSLEQPAPTARPDKRSSAR